jgi:hypothetical protein
MIKRALVTGITGPEIGKLAGLELEARRLLEVERHCAFGNIFLLPKFHLVVGHVSSPMH